MMQAHSGGSNRPDEMEAEDQEWKRKLRRLETRIERAGGRDLRVLEASGCERRAVVRLLALAATDDDDSLALMRNRQAVLKSLARRLKTLASDLAEFQQDPLMRVSWWFYLKGGGSVLGMPIPQPWTDVVGVPLIPVSMKWIAQVMEREATRFGQFLRRYSHINLGVVMLLARCPIWQTLAGRRRPRLQVDHLNELARLLTDAFESAGSNKEFSADGLRQIFKRHGRRMISLWLKFSDPPPPTLIANSVPDEMTAILKTNKQNA